MPLETRNTKPEHLLVGDVYFSFEISWRDKSLAKYEWCKNPMLMRMWLKWHNHLHSKQKRNTIMQMTEAFMLFNGWRGFCDIQETVPQKGDISNWYSFIVNKSLHFTPTWLSSQCWPISASQFLPILSQECTKVLVIFKDIKQITRTHIWEATELMSLELLHRE